MTKLLLKNSIFNVSILLLKLVVAFVMTPVIVKALGRHDYGINEIVLATVGYMGLLEIGMQPAVTRFIARYEATKNKAELQKIFSSALAFSFAIGILTAFVLVIWSLTGAIGLTPKGTPTARYSIFLLIVAFQVLASFPGNVVQCVHQGHQRYGLTSAITAVNTIIGTTIIYYFLTRDHGLLTLTLVNVIGLTTKFILYGYLLTLEPFGSYRFQFRLINKETIRELFQFGIKSFIMGISSRMNSSIGPLVVGILIGPAYVVFYTIPSNLVGYLRNVFQSATLGFMPFFSGLHASKDLVATQTVYLKASRYTAGLSVFGFCSTAIFGPAFLAIWMGTEYARECRTIIYLLAAAFGFRMLFPYNGRLLTGMDKHGILARISLMEASSNLVLSIVLVYPLGKEGIALSVLISCLIFDSVVLVKACEQIGKSAVWYLGKVFLPLLPSLFLLGGYGYYIHQRYTINGYPSLLVAAGIGGVLYFLCFIFTAVGRRERKELFLDLVSLRTHSRPFWQQNKP